MTHVERARSARRPRPPHVLRASRDGRPSDGIEMNGPALTIREVRTLDNPYLPPTIEIRGVADVDAPAEPDADVPVPRFRPAPEPPPALTAPTLAARLAPHAWIALALLAVFAFTVVPDLAAPILPGPTALVVSALVGLALLALAGLSLVRTSTVRR